MTSAAPLYDVPIPRRPQPGIAQRVQLVAFNAVFMLGMLGLHAVQCFSIPLDVFSATIKPHTLLTDWTKDLFARLLVFITMVWAPTTLRITVDEDDDDLDLRKIIQRDDKGNVIGIDLPDRMVMMSNHQVYCDWSYIWSLLYFANLQYSIYIILKASLKWVPLVGPAMQMFRFVFMHRSWAADKLSLSEDLAKMGQRVNRSLESFVLLIFPEGTLVSPLTRPASKKFAEKMQIPDCRHTLLPRSTGLQFCLRTLVPRIPTLKLLDATIAYPGIPNGGYGQDYYTLQSIYSNGIPPPVIHMHLHSYSAKYEVPIGIKTLSGVSTSIVPEETAEERQEFSDWLLKRWREKDDRLQMFLDEGKLSKGNYVDIPVKLRSPWELVTMLSCAVVGLWLWKISLVFIWRYVLFR